MRILALSGYMPNLVACSCCEKSEVKSFYFVPDINGIVCDECVKNYNFNKMFAFDLKKQSLEKLSAITEAYLLRCVEKNLKTLDFYKQLVVN